MRLSRIGGLGAAAALTVLTLSGCNNLSESLTPSDIDRMASEICDQPARDCLGIAIDNKTPSFILNGSCRKIKENCVANTIRLLTEKLLPKAKGL